MGGSGIHMRGGESRQLPPSPRLEMRRESKRRGRGRAGSSAVRDDYFGSRANGEASASSPLISPTSPVKHPTTLGRLASYMGFGHGDGDEEAGGRGRARSRSRSSRPSFTTSARSRSRSPSRASSEGWGYRESDVDTYSEVSDRASGEEGYTSSLADDTSLPPQSRPGSPTLPLVPVSGDGIFGDSGRGGEFEPKDFPSIAVPSRQTILLPDEDLSIRFIGYRTDPLRNVLWWIGCFLSLGVLGLVGRWVPSVWVKFCGREVAFDEAKEGSWLVVEVSRSSSRNDACAHCIDTFRRPAHRPHRRHTLSLPPLHRISSIRSCGWSIARSLCSSRPARHVERYLTSPAPHYQRRGPRRRRSGERSAARCRARQYNMGGDHGISQGYRLPIHSFRLGPCYWQVGHDSVSLVLGCLSHAEATAIGGIPNGLLPGL